MTLQLGIALVLALLAAYGGFLLYTGVAFGWQGVSIGPKVAGEGPRRARVREWLVQAGLGDVRPAELLAVVAVLALLGGLAAFAVFGGLIAPLAAALFAGGFPVASARTRRKQRRLKAQESWPRMLEELRLQATTMGRSVPQALFAVGRNGPEELRPAFAAAEREWLVSTDFERTLAVLKAELADPTADAVCETLSVAQEVGGSDLGKRLEALIEDRTQDVRGRKDARSKQSGARFARWFVIVVPLGMALAGLSIAEGRAAYASPGGQVVVALALALIVVCWLWSSRYMRLPEEPRVFYR